LIGFKTARGLSALARDHEGSGSPVDQVFAKSLRLALVSSSEPVKRGPEGKEDKTRKDREGRETRKWLTPSLSRKLIRLASPGLRKRTKRRRKNKKQDKWRLDDEASNSGVGHGFDQALAL